MTDTPRTTKNQRRDDAREAARIAREKAAKRKKLLKWLIPTIASVVIVAVVAGVVWAVIALQPAPKKEAGPLNMISDGIVFESDGAGGVQHVATKAIAKGADPVPTTPREGLLNIQTLVDFSCPACKQFEENFSTQIQQLVAEGTATLEVRPVAILDYRGYTTDYSTRANNVAACVANYAPESFLDVMAAMYSNQPSEGGPGLSNSELVKIVTGTGLDNEDVNRCVSDESFTPWVTAATARSGVRGTPTVIINGTQWDSQAVPQFGDFVASELLKLQAE
ncbi:DsbA family protein [Protaetiibacter larvae]|uniref:DsbA family protein n=1 Tax=Protaetiibacter larvae TaxID=2592654 RepID=UPI00143D7C9E|nr:thioredoxin domain-containing protein [Protaetiibacter larvae]